MPRATWSGMISFGLVNIPIKVFNTAREEKISFHQMHKDDSGRVRYEKVCRTCGKPLETDDIIKGYEYKKGQYVLIDDEELDKISLKTTWTISIAAFVDESELDPLQLEKAFYIAPDENGEHAYVLLREALSSNHKIGIGKVILRNREDLAAIRVVDGVLVMEILHYCDEIIKPDDMGIPSSDVQVSESELDLAKVLVEHMTSEFDPAAYHDDYEAALRDLINKKIEGQEVVAPTEPQPTNVIDIMSMLKASLESAEKEPAKLKKSA